MTDHGPLDGLESFIDRIEVRLTELAEMDRAEDRKEAVPVLLGEIASAVEGLQDDPMWGTGCIEADGAFTLPQPTPEMRLLDGAMRKIYSEALLGSLVRDTGHLP